MGPDRREDAVIRVGIVDDQRLVREGLRTLLTLTEDLRAVFEAADAAEARRLLSSNEVDVLLLDVRMPGVSGPQLLAALAEEGRQPPTLVLTTFDDDDALVESLRAGARGFLLKDVSLSQLAEAVRTVARGGTLILPALTDRMVRRLRRAQPPGPVHPQDRLTSREIEILRMITGGYGSREIGALLGLAEGTVKNHTSNILTKLGARDRTHAVLKAIELGYLP
jgi:DNA-binding NarL/FixJ family response regulator